MFYFRDLSEKTFKTSTFCCTVIEPLVNKSGLALVWTVIRCYPLVILVAGDASLKDELDANVGRLPKRDVPDDQTVHVAYSLKLNKYGHIAIRPTWFRNIGPNGNERSGALRIEARHRKEVKGQTCTAFAPSRGRQCRNPASCITGLCHKHTNKAFFLTTLIQSLQTTTAL